MYNELSLSYCSLLRRGYQTKHPQSHLHYLEQDVYSVLCLRPSNDAANTKSRHISNGRRTFLNILKHSRWTVKKAPESTLNLRSCNPSTTRMCYLQHHTTLCSRQPLCNQTIADDSDEYHRICDQHSPRGSCVPADEECLFRRPGTKQVVGFEECQTCKKYRWRRRWKMALTILRGRRKSKASRSRQSLGSQSEEAANGSIAESMTGIQSSSLPLSRSLSPCVNLTEGEESTATTRKIREKV